MNRHETITFDQKLENPFVMQKKSTVVCDNVTSNLKPSVFWMRYFYVTFTSLSVSFRRLTNFLWVPRTLYCTASLNNSIRFLYCKWLLLCISTPALDSCHNTVDDILQLLSLFLLWDESFFFKQPPINLLLMISLKMLVIS